MKLKLSHTLFLLVAVPLFFELFFVGSLYVLLEQVEQERSREAHAREISKHLNALHQILLSGIAYTSGDAVQGLYHKSETVGLSDYMYKEFEILKDLTKGNVEEAQHVERIKGRLLETWSRLKSLKVKWHEAGSVATLEYMEKVKPAIRDITVDVDDLMKAEESIEKESPLKQKEQRDLIKLLLQGGVAFNVLLALFLALYFNRGITNRLAVLMDNIRRLNKNQALNPPLTGTDEFAHMDKVFHHVANTLSLAAEKERTILENLRVVLESLPVGVIVLYEDGEVEIANQALTQMLGYVDSPVERNIRDLIDLDDSAIKTRKGVASAQESARALLTLVREDGQEKSWSERDAIKVDGARVPVEVGIRRIDTASGPRLLALVVDVTARREIERLKQEFLSMVSHDLRTPLNSMQAFLELLADGIYGEITEAGNRKVGQLEGEVERLMRLIQQLLDLDRLESGASPLVLETVDATSLVNQALASVHGVAERRNIKLELLATPVMVKVSPDKIVQVLVNLLSNSIKFSPDNSTITVSLARHSNQASFKVIDRGRGIPAVMLDKVFERFKQVKDTDATQKGGAGLGLAICKSIIEQHNGKIGVESQEGHGSTFWFKLPAVTA